MVPLLQSAQISMNPYWANAIIQIVRAIVSIFGLFFNKKLKRRPVYLGCCIMSCTGTLTLSCYYFWSQNGELSDTWIVCTRIIIMVLRAVDILLTANFDSKGFEKQFEM